MKNLSETVSKFLLERRMKKKKISDAIRKVMSNNDPNNLTNLNYGRTFVDPTTTISRDSSTA